MTGYRRCWTWLGVPRLDRVTRPGLRLLVHGPVRKLNQALCMIGGLAMSFLEVAPFPSSIQGSIASRLALRTLARDGMFTALGFTIRAALGGGVFGFSADLAGRLASNRRQQSHATLRSDRAWL